MPKGKVETTFSPRQLNGAIFDRQTNAHTVYVAKSWWPHQAPPTKMRIGGEKIPPPSANCTLVGMTPLNHP